MAMFSIGDLAQSLQLRRQTHSLKSEVQTLSTEVTTGVAVDLGNKVRGDFTPLAALELSLARTGAYRAAATETAQMLQAMQVSLAAVNELAGDHAAKMLIASTSTSATHLAAGASDSRSHFALAVSALNARYADRTLFAGTQTQGAAVADADTLLSALSAVTSGVQTAEALELAIDDWFDSPGGFVATGYLGGPALAPIGVARGETVTLDVTALDPAILGTLKAFALGAMMEQPGFSGNTSVLADVARRSAERLMESQSDRAGLAARIGHAEARTASAAMRNLTEHSALEIARSELVSVDPYDTAVRLEIAQTRLEALYTITARISRLSLVDFLR